jgi:ABC-type lipoprotein release transport system permease subunit
MTFLRLLLRNLAYHWRGNLAVFLGIALGSAVLTGALVVGDSLRGSLKALTLDQLGWIDSAMVPGRFFRAQLAAEVNGEHKSAALLLQGSVSRKDSKDRVGRVTVLGVDAAFWPTGAAPEGKDFWASDANEAVLNRSFAKTLGANVGDMIDLYIQRASNVPGETLMGKRSTDDVIEKVAVKVRAIEADEGMARFSLKPTPEPARNVFVPIRFLQKKLDLAGQANALLIAGAAPDLHTHLTLADWGLRYRSPQDRAEAFLKLLAGNSTEPALKKARWQDNSGLKPVNRIPDELAEAATKNGNLLTKDAVIAYYERSRDYHVLESRRMLLEPQVVQALDRLVPNRHDPNAQPRWRLTPVLIYLADTINDGIAQVPYSIIASDDRTILKGGKEQYVLADDQILLMTWPGSPLKVKPGKEVTVSFYVPDAKNHLQLKSATFKVQAIDKIEGPQDDPDWTPEVPGVTDKLDITNWVNPPFPYNARRNKRPDIEYSIRYRTTPRAYVNLEKAQELWKNRFGDLTSIQVRLGNELPDTLPKALLVELKPEQGGFVFQPVRAQAIKASAGTVDFGEYFLYFSFFLIVSALLLVGLLVRLNIDRRAAEVGLLLATGWTHARAFWLLFGEGALLAVIGGLVGIVGAAGYAWLMLRFLSANWPGSEGLAFLTLHADEHSLIHGYFGSVLVSLGTLWWATRLLRKLSPRSLLSGETQSAGPASAALGWSRWLIPICVLGALGLAVSAKSLPSQEAEAGSFFGSGALLLTACLVGVWNGLKILNRAGSPQPSLTRLGIRNAGRHAVRSVLTVGLLAAASFLIVSVESFHKETDQHFTQKTGGSGGFAFFADGSVPMFEDLNQPKVLRAHDLDTPEMRGVKFYPCRVQAGDDASCLNLYKPLKPRVMGILPEMVRRGGFHFSASKAETAEEKANPWLLLERKPDGAIPAIIDANSAQYILKVGLGETIDVNNDRGEPQKLRVVAILDESIFQSEILVAEQQFLTLFPQQAGFSFVLIDAGTDDPQALAAIEKELSRGLVDFNMDVQTTASRLQGYLAVENMYLKTFQALGGLGLILGAAGLAIVLLRGVWERRAELALLQALGFRAGQLAWLVLAENVFLLILGLASGTVSALLAVAPHLVGSGAPVLWGNIALLLGIVLAVGLVSAGLAVWSTLKTPVLTALRRE